MTSALALSMALGLGSIPDVSLGDLRNFPPHAVCREWCEFSLAHRNWVDERRYACEERWAWYYHEWHQEAFHCWWLLDNLRIATDPKMPLESRLRWLRDTREIVGMDRYYRGDFGPVVPYWRFAPRP